MTLQLIQFGSNEYKQMVDLRYHILRQPLGLTFTDEDLRNEINDILAGSFEGGRIEACCILTPEEPGEARLRQMAVSAGLRGRGAGRGLMKFVEKVAYDRGYRKITMHARKTAVGFYEKLGYRVVSGEFVEVTIPHYTMEKYL